MLLEVHVRGTEEADGSWKLYFYVIRGSNFDRLRWCDQKWFTIPHKRPPARLLKKAWVEFNLYLRLAHGKHAVVVSAEFIEKNGVVFRPEKKLLLKNFPPT